MCRKNSINSCKYILQIPLDFLNNVLTIILQDGACEKETKHVVVENTLYCPKERHLHRDDFMLLSRTVL